MPEKSSKEKYVEAFKALLEAKKEVMNDNNNPFKLDLPTHSNLPDETFISDEELDELSNKIGDAAKDNRSFARLWNIGTDIVIKGKTLIM